MNTSTNNGLHNFFIINYLLLSNAMKKLIFPSASLPFILITVLLCSLSSVQAQTPANDNCSGAITLTPGTSCNLTSGTTLSATQSLPAITCNGDISNTADDVWYKFTAQTTNQTITVNSIGLFDAVVDVRSGACNGVSIACADQYGQGSTERLPLMGLTVGSTYYIRIYHNGYSSPDRVNFAICIENAPVNDDCSNAITLTSATVCTPATGNTATATQSLAGINCNGITGTADDDIWYKFVAVAPYQTVTVEGVSSLNPVIDVRSGGCNGTTIACADANTNGTETVNLSGLTVGSTYYVRVYSRSDALNTRGTFAICVTYNPPANNDCSNAITLTSSASCTPVAGTTVNASQSLAGITCSGTAGTADDDVWYKFTAIDTKSTVRVVGGVGFNPVVDVRSGACNGTSIACADATASGGTENVNLTGLIVGNTYLVRVYSRGGNYTDQGTFTICLTYTPPINDECANAITLTPSSSCTTTTGTTVHASPNLSNTPACNGFVADDDVWYKFTAVNTTHRVEVAGLAGFEPYLQILSGSCNGANIACNRWAPDNIVYQVLTGLTIGATYFISVHSLRDGVQYQGTFTICVTIPPVNDECVNATTLNSSIACTPTAGTTVNATKSMDAIFCHFSTGVSDDDVWYKFTALASSHRVTVVGGVDFNGVVDVRTGTCNGSNIACADAHGNGGTETVDLTDLVIGNTYFIRIYSFLPEVINQGTFTICVTHEPPPDDNCEGAVSLTSSATCIPTSGRTLTATQSMAGIACGAITGTADDDVWYKFTAINYTHTVTVVGQAGFNAVVDVRTGICNGATVACADATTSGTETVNLTGLTLGATYFVRVYSRGGNFSDRGTFSICITHNSVHNDECANVATLNVGIQCNPTPGDTKLATQSQAAITCSGQTGTADDDVWYKFTATSANQTIEVVGEADFNAVVDVRIGSCDGAILVCADATTSGKETLSLTGLIAGSTYFVRVYSFGATPADRGNFTICVSAAPLNDECTAATMLFSDVVCSLVYGTTVNATQSLPGIDCGSKPNFGMAANDVWYKFTAVSSTHDIYVSSLGFDAVIDIRSGSCNGTTIACIDEANSSQTEAMSLTGLTIGNTYYVRIYSNFEVFQGEIVICLMHSITNDNCSNATSLTSNTFCTPTKGVTIEATQSLPAINCNGIGGADDDVWYKFTAVSTAHTVKVDGSEYLFDAVVDIRTGGCNGTSIACADATTEGGIETVNLTGLTVGNTYFVRVYSKGSIYASRTIFSICVTHACLPSVTLNEPITDGTVVKEAIRIIANNQVSGGIVTYRAAQSVTLQPGFSAISGAEKRFQAMTGGCP